MPSLILEYAGQTASLTYPPAIDQIVTFLFAGLVAPAERPRRAITVTQTGEDEFRLVSPVAAPVEKLKSADLADFLMDAVIRALVTDQASGVAIHAAALARGGKAILVAGVSGAGKSTLTAWMARNGFRHLTDELVILPGEASLDVVPFRRPLTLRTDAVAALETHGVIAPDSERLTCGDKVVFAPIPAPEAAPVAAGMILFPNWMPDAEFRIQPLTSGRSARGLLENNLNAANFADGGLSTLARYAGSLPAFRLTYATFDQLDGFLDEVVDDVLASGLSATAWHRIHDAFGGGTADMPPGHTPAAPASTEAAQPVDIKAPTPSRGDFKLTVGMATYDDFDGAYFTLQSLRLNNPDLAGEIEFVVIDNNPTGRCAEALKALEDACPTYRYVPFFGNRGTAIAKDMLFTEARGEFVLCLDSHVLLAPGALPRLTRYFEDNPETPDLVQGPLVYDQLDQRSTHFEPVWKGGMYGVWGTDTRADDPDAEPFDIPMQGMGLFACRRDAWPGFNLKFRGFGGEEGYIHEKFRQRGGRTLCLPFLRWLHRFARPMGVPYQVSWEDRVRNYVIGFRELGLDEAPIAAHFEELLGAEPAAKILAEVHAELANPFNRFDAIRLINLDTRPDRLKTMEERFAALGIGQLVSRLSAIPTPDDTQTGRALSHRAAILDAHRRGLKNVLVLEDDTVFDGDALQEIERLAGRIDADDWDMLSPGGSGTAVAHNSPHFETLLAALPATPEAMAQWLEAEGGLDRFFARSGAVRLQAATAASA